MPLRKRFSPQSGLQVAEKYQRETLRKPEIRAIAGFSDFVSQNALFRRKWRIRTIRLTCGAP